MFSGAAIQLQRILSKRSPGPRYLQSRGQITFHFRGLRNPLTVPLWHNFLLLTM